MASSWISPADRSQLAPTGTDAYALLRGARPAQVSRPWSAARVVALPLPVTIRRPSSMRRVYLRRRLVALLLLAAVALSGFQLATVAAGHLGSPVPTTGVPDVPVVLHRASPGDTLWSLASRYSPGGDIRRSLDELVRLNGEASLAVGDVVRLPASWFGAGR